MRRDEVLDMLELAPRWRRNQPQRRVWHVLELVGADGDRGWLLADGEPAGDAARLLDNVLLAFGLVRGQAQLLDADALEPIMQAHPSGWLWCAGTRPSQIVIHDRTLLLSPSLQDMLTDDGCKARLWHDWCTAFLPA